MLYKLRKLMLFVAVATLSSLLLASCGQSTKEPETTGSKTTETKSNAVTSTTPNASAAGENKTTAAAAANQIVIENFAFKPANLTVAAGTKVTWINKDDAPHTATSTDKRFNSNALDTDEQFSFVFTDKGDYAYFCALHLQMKGQITVK